MFSSTTTTTTALLTLCVTISASFGCVQVDHTKQYDGMACEDVDTGRVDFSADPKLCNGKFAREDLKELQLSLAYDMFTDCKSKCVFNIVGSKSSVFQWSKSGRCWLKLMAGKCRKSDKDEASFGEAQRAKYCTLESIPDASAAAAQAEPKPVVTVTNEFVEIPAENGGDPTSCIPVNTELTDSTMANLCSHHVTTEEGAPDRTSVAVGCDDAYTFDVRIALANGMFGSASGLDRDCAAYCLFDFLTSDVHYSWRPGRQCWQQEQGFECGSAAETAFAVGRKSDFCPSEPVSRPDSATTQGYSCVQVRNELTSHLMDGLCAHQSPCQDATSCVSPSGAQLGPSAQACNPEDNHNLRISLANGLFGKNSGTDRNCAAHCVFDYITPKSVAYKWESKSGCWKRKTGDVTSCGGKAERDYAVVRQSSLCPPTMAPTLSPSFTMPPTISPTVSPTTSTPTVSPTISPTTSTPTVSPTISPTTSTPTISPTVSPTTSTPTVSPTISPTTSTPTVSPTSNPTVSPTTSPTNMPTTSPTKAPTVFCHQFNYTHTVQRVDQLCGHAPTLVCDQATGSCKNENGIEYGPAAKACNVEDQQELLHALANGMFGGADGELRDCSENCVWSADRPNVRSFKWNSKKSKLCWSRKTKRCKNNDKLLREYVNDRSNLLCTNIAPHQQITNPGRVL